MPVFVFPPSWSSIIIEWTMREKPRPRGAELWEQDLKTISIPGRQQKPEQWAESKARSVLHKIPLKQPHTQKKGFLERQFHWQGLLTWASQEENTRSWVLVVCPSHGCLLLSCLAHHLAVYKLLVLSSHHPPLTEVEHFFPFQFAHKLVVCYSTRVSISTDCGILTRPTHEADRSHHPVNPLCILDVYTAHLENGASAEHYVHDELEFSLTLKKPEDQ